MRVKTFQGRTLEEVLPEIRSELGGGAVVLGQRQVVNGGIGGFFGKRMIEVTAADRMPSDTELVDLEDRIMGRSGAPADQSNDFSDQHSTGGRGSTLDLVDTWAPGDDDAMPDHVAAAIRSASAEFASSGYEPLAPPRRSSTVNAAISAYEAPTAEPSPQTTPDVAADNANAEPLFVPAQETPQQQARRLAAQAHEAIAAATREIEQQVAASGSRTIHLAVNEPARVEESNTTTLRAQVEHVAEANAVSSGTSIAAAVAPQPVYEPAPAPRVAAKPSMPSRSGDEQGVRAGLFASGVDTDIADVILNQLALHRLPFSATRDVRALTREIVAETLRVDTGWAALGRTHRVAYVGASGAGKSSVVAKLAEGYVNAGMRVGVISIIAGSTSKAQIAAHANDPLVRRGTADIQFAADPNQMISAVERFSDRDVVLIDTPSSMYLDASSYAAAAACLTAVRIDDVQVVLPLSLSVREAESVVEHFRPLGVKHMVVTKLDESRYAGQLLNFGFRFGVPITFLTDGPSVPEDIRSASVNEIAQLIVPPNETGDIDA